MEKSFDDLVEAYAELPVAERKRLVEYAAMHPEWALDLEDARVEAFFAGTRDEPVTDAVLARYASMRLLHTRHESPMHVQDACRRIEQVLASDPVARARFERFVDRIAQAEAPLNAVTQFERLSGRRLAPSPEEAVKATGDRSPRARRTPIGSRIAKWSASGVTVTVVCYALAFVGYRVHPPLETTAYRAAQQRLANWDVRSVPLAANTDEERLRAAIEVVRNSFYYEIGVVPSYRRERLARASVALRNVAMGAEAPPVRQEARYFLGLAELALGETEAARADLQVVSRNKGFRSPDAEDVLKKMAN